jgi:HKD family nuclease
MLVAPAQDRRGLSMSEQQRVRLILNEDEEHHHGQALAKLLPGADRLECLAAFATNSGIEFILNELRAGLVAGLEQGSQSG